MRCPRCQAENPDDARFCEECGARLALTCPHCGAEVSPGKKFCRSCGGQLTVPPTDRVPPPVAYTPKHLAERILTSRAALEGERKQVTVLFADLKGSMELLADRDPEDARKLLDPVLERMMEAVHRYEGTVNQVMGDGIMALFGAPVAHEDHGVRACYAALDMQGSIRRYADELWRTDGVTVKIRVGLNSGEVVVRAIGSDLRVDYTAVGPTTHLAARMEQLATPGTVLLTADTLQLAEGYVTAKPLGPVPVKGLEAPMEVYELTGAGPLRSRLHAAAARGFEDPRPDPAPADVAATDEEDAHGRRSESDGPQTARVALEPAGHPGHPEWTSGAVENGHYGGSVQASCPSRRSPPSRQRGGNAGKEARRRKDGDAVVSHARRPVASKRRRAVPATSHRGSPRRNFARSNGPLGAINSRLLCAFAGSSARKFTQMDASAAGGTCLAPCRVLYSRRTCERVPANHGSRAAEGLA
jgi:class 3 adenylate cyclase/ribosomal protein L40E